MNATHNTVYIETSIPSLYYTLRTDRGQFRARVGLSLVDDASELLERR